MVRGRPIFFPTMLGEVPHMPLPKDGPLLVRELMATDLTTLQEDEALLDATLIFSRSTIRHIPILRGKRLVGIVTERDLKHYTPSILSGIPVEEYNRLMETTPLSKIMTRELLTVRPDTFIYEAVQILLARRIGCLPVVERDELKGIITATDMLRMLAELLIERGDMSPRNPN
jgi:acetoin utilization protein AcuB